jgi:hypothetical protein
MLNRLKDDSILVEEQDYLWYIMHEAFSWFLGDFSFTLALT